MTSNYRPGDETPEEDWQVYIAEHPRKSHALALVLGELLDDGIITVATPATSESDATYNVPQPLLEMDLITLYVYWYLKGYDDGYDDGLSSGRNADG